MGRQDQAVLQKITSKYRDTFASKNVNLIYFEPVLIFLQYSTNVQYGRVIRALELDLISKGQGLNPLCGTNKFQSMDIVKPDAVQLYKYQRSNKVVGALVL